MKKKILTLGIVLALVAVLVVPMAVFAADDTTTVTANFESITITAPVGESNLVLTQSATDTSLVTDTGEVTSTVPYDVTAVDAMDGTPAKDGSDAGKMTSYTGTAYATGVVIADAVKAGSAMVGGYGQTAAAISDTPISVIINAPAGAGVDSEITVTVTTASESALTPPAVYRIVITFTATANS